MHPILFKVGNLSIESYWVFMILGFIMGGIVVYLETKNKGLASRKARNLIFITIISAFIGSRLGYVFLNFSSYQKDLLKILLFWKGGFSWQGGFIVAFLITSFLIFKNDKKNPGKWFDSYVLGILIGHSIGRIGCFLNGCCYGHITSLPWGVVFPAVDSFHRHPTQLYASGAALIIFFLLRVLKRYKFFDGFVFVLFIIFYGVYRFIVEFYRIEEPFLGFMTQAQLASLILIIAGVVIFFWKKGEKRKIGKTNKKKAGEL
jgi:phosphatidylglycerol:prolipoprotein diacylglycerol transferase